MGKYIWVSAGIALLAASVAACSSNSADDDLAAQGGPTPPTLGGGGRSSGGSQAYGTGGGAGGYNLGTGGSASGTLDAGAANEGDNYEPVGTNPFVIAAHDPLSTFAADVDTASYDIFRRDINLGFLPQSASVRLEEYVNYFAYDYPAPPTNATEPFQLTLGAAQNPFRNETVLLRVGIQGQDPPEWQKKPANLVFLVDVSGSMQSADRLPLVQQVLIETLDVLDPTDTVSIVTYAGSTEVRLTPTPVSQSAAIVPVIDGLAAGGSTAGGAGINLAYAQAEAGFIQGGLNHVLLCTDGDFNVGVSSTEELVNLIVEKRKTGITLTTLGFGVGNLNDAMMEGIANHGNGIYGVISDAEQAHDYVQERMLSTLVHIAKDMKIQVEFNPAEVYAYRLLGYENRSIADNDFRNDLVDAGEIGAGHRVTALYEVVLSGGSIPPGMGSPEAEDGAAYDGAVEVAAGDLVSVKVRYKTPGAADADPAFEVAQSAPATAAAQTLLDLDKDFGWAIAIAAFSEILKESPYAAPDKLSVIEEIIQNPAYAGDPEKVEFIGLFASAKALLAP